MTRASRRALHNESRLFKDRKTKKVGKVLVAFIKRAKRYLSDPNNAVIETTQSSGACPQAKTSKVHVRSIAGWTDLPTYAYRELQYEYYPFQCKVKEQAKPTGVEPTATCAPDHADLHYCLTGCSSFLLLSKHSTIRRRELTPSGSISSDPPIDPAPALLAAADALDGILTRLHSNANATAACDRVSSNDVAEVLSAISSCRTSLVASLAIIRKRNTKLLEQQLEEVDAEEKALQAACRMAAAGGFDSFADSFSSSTHHPRISSYAHAVGIPCDTSAAVESCWKLQSAFDPLQCTPCARNPRWLVRGTVFVMKSL